MTLLIVKGLLLAVCAVDAVFQMLYYVHMLQLNSYRPERYRKWCREHEERVLPRWRLLGVLAFALMLMFRFADHLLPYVYGGAAVVMLLMAVLDRPKKAKKPLVYTKRVQRLLLTESLLLVIIYTGAWFLPQQMMAAALLLPLLLTVALTWLANAINTPMERSINNGFVRDAQRILSELPSLTVVGITGSYGKTSTKNYLSALLAVKYNVLMTPESFNTPMGVVRTVRERLQPSHEVFIAEMGAKNKGDIKEICDICHPRYGMITSIGEQHLETFKTVETIVDTKFELADALPADGAVFVNIDNEYIAARPVENVPCMTYGLTERAGYRAGEISVTPAGTQFTVTAPNGESRVFVTKLLGAHNVQNLAGCIAVAHTLGISLADLVQPVRQLKTVEHRLQLLPNGYIDDAYNSNPAGFRSALEVLKGFDAQRVLVTPGMVELGERQDALNKELGACAAGCCDYAVLVGEKQAPPLREGLLSADFPEERIFVVKTLQEGLAVVNALPAEGQRIVLLENDLPDNF